MKRRTSQQQQASRAQPLLMGFESIAMGLGRLLGAEQAKYSPRKKTRQDDATALASDWDYIGRDLWAPLHKQRRP